MTSDILERDELELSLDHAKPSHRNTDGTDGTSFRRAVRRWRNRAIVLIMAAAVAFGTVQLIHHQAAGTPFIKLGNVSLTAPSIDVGSTQSGAVTSVAVRAGDQVVSGQRVGTINVVSMNAKGTQVVKPKTLVAPADGVVVDDPMTVGSNLLVGTSFLEMYDPAALQLVTTVPLSYLSKISIGMTAELTAPGMPGKITAVLHRAVPRVGGNQTAVPANSLQLVFVAQHPSQVAKLVPGLRFEGQIDTRTADSSGHRAQYVGSR